MLVRPAHIRTMTGAPCGALLVYVAYSKHVYLLADLP